MEIFHYSLEAYEYLKETYEYLKAPSVPTSLGLLRTAFSIIVNCNQENQRIVALITIFILATGYIRHSYLTKKIKASE